MPRRPGGLPTPFSVLSAWSQAMSWSLGRALSFGLLDLLTLPARHGGATRRIEQAQLRLTSDVVDQITRVRQSWVRAVAAQQTLKYAKQVYDSAEAGAELAKRMQAAGNFNRITRARSKLLRRCRHPAERSAAPGYGQPGRTGATAGAEMRRRTQTLKLPERLPELP